MNQSAQNDIGIQSMIIRAEFPNRTTRTVISV